MTHKDLQHIISEAKDGNKVYITLGGKNKRVEYEYSYGDETVRVYDADAEYSTMEHEYSTAFMRNCLPWGLFFRDYQDYNISK